MLFILPKYIHKGAIGLYLSLGLKKFIIKYKQQFYMALIHLIYVSRATHLMSQEALGDILVVAQAHNTECNITGMLIYKDQSFLQILEGEGAQVLSLFNRIKADQRHCRVKRLLCERITARNFPNWQMGFENLEYWDKAQLPNYAEFMNKDYEISGFIKNPNSAHKLLAYFSAVG